MRTAIYVHEPSTVTIRAKGANEAAARLCRYNRAGNQLALGTHQLERGIYVIESRGELDVSGSHLDIVPLSNDKNIPPDPKAFVALEPGATAQSVQRFLSDAMDISVGGPPSQ